MGKAATACISQLESAVCDKMMGPPPACCDKLMRANGEAAFTHNNTQAVQMFLTRLAAGTDKKAVPIKLL